MYVTKLILTLGIYEQELDEKKKHWCLNNCFI